MRLSPFYVRHGLNSGVLSRRKISRSAVKEYVKRIRQALSRPLHEMSLALKPTEVLVSASTVGNETQYRLPSPCQLQYLRSRYHRRRAYSITQRIARDLSGLYMQILYHTPPLQPLAEKCLLEMIRRPFTLESLNLCVKPTIRVPS